MRQRLNSKLSVKRQWDEPKDATHIHHQEAWLAEDRCIEAHTQWDAF